MKQDALSVTGELNELVNTLKDAVTESKTFILEQAPDVIKQLILYERTMSVIYLLMLFSVFVVVGYVIYKAIYIVIYKVAKKENSDIAFAFLIISITASLISIPLFIVTLSRVVKVWFAPKVYLLEYLSDLLR